MKPTTPPGDDPIDHDAVLVRRELLRRRALLVGTAALAVGGVGCQPPRPCLSPPARDPECGRRSVAVPPTSQYWKVSPMDEIQPLQGPLFLGETPTPDTASSGWRHRNYSFEEGSRHEVNLLSPLGGAAFEELAPLLSAGAKVTIKIAITPQDATAVQVQGSGADGPARAASIRTFLSSRGVSADITGYGGCSTGAYSMSVFVTACLA